MEVKTRQKILDILTCK